MKSIMIAVFIALGLAGCGNGADYFRDGPMPREGHILDTHKNTNKRAP